MDVFFKKISKNRPNFDSVYYAVIFFMILHPTCTGLSYGVIDVIGVLLLGLRPRKKYPPTLLNASGSKR